MLARKVAARLKPESLPRFTHVIEDEILPWLRKQEGFLHLITLATPDHEEVATITFWSHEPSADAHTPAEDSEVAASLEGLLDGIPYVKTFDVVSATLEISPSCCLTQDL
jgi:hypothetical protein